MIPIGDRLATRRPAVLTVVLILVNIAVYVGLQPDAQAPGGSGEAIRFSYEYAAIPCEVAHGRPLTQAEVELTLRGRSSACLTPSEQLALPAPLRQPVFPHKRVWLAVLFSMFLHGSLLHLGGNLLYLWIFGNNIEDRLGRARYALFYLAGGVVATLAHVAADPSSTVPLVGASGAVAAVMGAYLVWYPQVRVRTLVFFIFITFVEIRAVWLLGFWFVSQFFLEAGTGVAWVAHVGGFCFGVAVALALKAIDGARASASRLRRRYP